MAIHIEDAIIRLRKHRNVLRTDDAVTGYLESAKFVDRAWFVDSAQLDLNKTRNGLYEAPKEGATPDQLKYERWSAIIAKLSLPAIRSSPVRPGSLYSQAAAIAQLQEDARALYRDGHLPHEREEIEEMALFEQRRVPPAVSHETLRVENNLTPKRRAEMRKIGFDVPGVRQPKASRKAGAPPSLDDTYSAALYNRARLILRPKVELTLRYAMMDVVDWVRKVPSHPRDKAQHGEQLITLEYRYTVENLPEVDPTLASTSRAGRFAAAVASGEQSSSSFDVFVPDLQMAVAALHFLGSKV